MYITGQKLKDRYLKPKKMVVYYLSDFQRGNEELEKLIGKRIEVLHYHEPYVWNYYIHFKDKSKGNIRSNRIILYGYNFDVKKRKEYICIKNKSNGRKRF